MKEYRSCSPILQLILVLYITKICIKYPKTNVALGPDKLKLDSQSIKTFQSCSYIEIDLYVAFASK